MFCFSLWPIVYTRSDVFSRPIFASACVQLYASQCICSVNVMYFQIFDYQVLFPCRIIFACVLGGFVLPAGPSPLILIAVFYLTIMHKRHNGIHALIRPVCSLSIPLSLSCSHSPFLSLYQYSAPSFATSFCE